MLRYIRPVVVAGVLAFFVLAIGRAAPPKSAEPATTDEGSKAARSDDKKRLVKEQMEALAGKWEIVFCLDDGREIELDSLSLVFKGNTATELIDLGTEPKGSMLFYGIHRFPYQIDLEVGKDPKVIHFTNPGGAFPARKYAAIYRIKSGTLELCYFSDQDKEKDAPKTFDGKKGTGQRLERYKKVTAKKKVGNKK